MLKINLPDNLCIEYDPVAHAAYIRVKEGRVVTTKEEAPFIMVDLNAKGELLGIEVINPESIAIKVHKVLKKVADQFDLPALKNLRPEALSNLYAHA